MHSVLIYTMQATDLKLHASSTAGDLYAMTKELSLGNQGTVRSLNRGLQFLNPPPLCVTSFMNILFQATIEQELPPTRNQPHFQQSLDTESGCSGHPIIISHRNVRCHTSCKAYDGHWTCRLYACLRNLSCIHGNYGYKREEWGREKQNTRLY